MKRLRPKVAGALGGAVPPLVMVAHPVKKSLEKALVKTLKHALRTQLSHTNDKKSCNEQKNDQIETNTSRGAGGNYFEVVGGGGVANVCRSPR